MKRNNNVGKGTLSEVKRSKVGPQFLRRRGAAGSRFPPAVRSLESLDLWEEEEEEEEEQEDEDEDADEDEEGG